MTINQRKQWKKSSPEEIKAYVESVFEAIKDDACPVDQLKQFTNKTRRASCGECVICREGLLQLSVVTDGITRGLGREQDVEIIQDISEDLVLGSCCDFGKEVGKIIKASIAESEDDFTKHIKRKRCDALVCKKFITTYIAPEKCTGCGKCVAACSVSAIAGDNGMIHVIDASRCERCGACAEVCGDHAILRAGAILPKLPEIPVPVGSFTEEDAAGGLMSRKRRRKSE